MCVNKISDDNAQILRYVYAFELKHTREKKSIEKAKNSSCNCSGCMHLKLD